MSAINSENRDAWQTIADDVSKDRPSVGKRVRVSHGRCKRFEGVVLVHKRDEYSNAFRYGGDASLQLREMVGRRGFVCKIQPDDGGKVRWVKADRLEVLV